VIDLPDHRALSLLDEPYSGYCKVCWNPVYVLWIDAPHGGVCPYGNTRACDCRDAMARAETAAILANLTRDGTINQEKFNGE
jgi:hypothetical protein